MKKKKKKKNYNTDTKTLSQSEPGSNGNEGVLPTPKNFKIGASSSDTV